MIRPSPASAGLTITVATEARGTALRTSGCGWSRATLLRRRRPGWRCCRRLRAMRAFSVVELHEPGILVRKAAVSVSRRAPVGEDLYVLTATGATPRQRESAISTGPQCSFTTPESRAVATKAWRPH